MKTWLEMKTEILAETNTEGEDFVSAAELLAWANDAKDMAEKEIVSLYDSYLETEGYIALVTGTAEYDLPADIFANKITMLMYDNGSEKYEIKRMKKKTKIMNVNENDDYQYRLINSAADGIKLKLYPESRETSSQNVTIFYIRESTAIADDDSLMDIPLADGFIKQYVKDKIKEKEIGPMNVNQFSPELVRERDLLIEALNHMVPSDSDDELELDTSVYEDMDIDSYGDFS
jgi:hypothetical protein